jgi:RNA polymerase sigma factor (sigma-70 family)
MAGDAFQPVLRRIRRLAVPPAGGLTDEHLLGRFIAVRDEAAFELLLRRHGGMVLGLCRRMVRHEQDAEDAFQATFLALARKAASIGRRAALGSWLYKVAYRAALAARERVSRRASLEVPLPELPAPEVSPATDWRDLGTILDAEIHRLPERYRVPFVLCYLEGKTLAEAAQLLDRPRATIGTRLARARQRLRLRLTSRGLGLAAAMAALLTERAATAGPTSALIGATVGAVTGGGVAPEAVTTLAEGVLHAMFVSKLKVVAAAVVVVVGLGSGVGGLGYRMYAQDGPALPRAKAGGGDTPGERPRLVLRGWGTATDPDGDCKFTVAKDKLTITVPGGDHDLGVERGLMNSPRVLRPVEGDFIAQVRVSGTFPTRDKSNTNERAPFHGAGLLLWKDANTYIRLERAKMNFNGDLLSYGNWELRKDGQWPRAGDASELRIKDEPTWLRLERRGDTVYGSVSQDGVQWTTMEPIKIDLPRKLLVGVSAGHDTPNAFEPTFEEFRLFQAVEDQ